MIEGLKVTISGTELADLCGQRADHHAERERVYAEQIASMESAKIEGMQYTGGDPVKALADKRAQHASEAAEMRFISEHVEPEESYLLARADLYKLGITASAF